MSEPSPARAALRKLIGLLERMESEWMSPEWLVASELDEAEAARAALHLLQGGLVTYFEEDALRPDFRRIVSPTRKYTGDNADAVYYDAPVDPDRSYRVTGKMDGAVYVALTVEAGGPDGKFGAKTAGVINDAEFDVDGEGRFEVYLGGPPRDRNWLALPADATRITTRHYFEEAAPRAAAVTAGLDLSIECLEDAGPAPTYDPDGVAAGIDRVVNFIETRTFGLGKPGTRDQPPFVSKVPNELPKPVLPGDHALAAADAAYSMCLYLLGPDDALVMRGRFPDCRYGGVALWNRHMQTLDYRTRSASLNRTQVELEDDGSFRVVIANRDPGVPNWLDTEGRGAGLVFWRFMLPEGDVEPITTEVMSIDSLGG